jgi:hypothetical protein
MAALSDSDLTHIEEPRTNREVLQQIVHMIEADREDRADDRELLESFITTQKEFNAGITVRVRTLEDCRISTEESVKQLKEQSKKWDITNTIMALAAAIAAFFGLKGS